MSEPVTIRVLLADDHHLARLGLKALLETAPDVTLVGEACDGAEALALYRSTAPDVVLVDLKMPKVDGVTLIGALARETPPGKAVVLSQLEGDESIYNALKAGAYGYVTKSAAGEEILDAIRAAGQGRKYLPQAIGSKLAARVSGEALSARERQILTFLAGGNSNKSIADSLQVSERTVAVHVTHIFAKLGVKNRAEAVSMGIKRGILS